MLTKPQYQNRALPLRCACREVPIQSNPCFSHAVRDEFSILLPNVSLEISKQLKQRVLDQVVLYNQSNSKGMQLSISIGGGTANKVDLLADVFKLADERMYQEKKKKARK